MFRSLRGWINEIASFGVDADRVEAFKQTELIQDSAGEWLSQG